MFHSRSFEIFTPNSFALDTTSFFTINDNGCSMQGNTQFFKFSFVELKFVSSCLSFFNSSTDDSILLVSCFHTFSDMVVSSTYFDIVRVRYIKRSFIIITNRRGPKFICQRTAAGTVPHSEEQSLLNFTRCLRSFRK